MQTTLKKDVVNSSQAEINKMPKVFSHSWATNYFFTPQKKKEQIALVGKFYYKQ